MDLPAQRKKPRTKMKSLPPARKRVAGKQVTYPKGIPIRISSAMHNFLFRKRRPGESWDKLLRRIHNQASRDGTPGALHECWFLPSTGQTATSEAKAMGISLKNGVLRGKDGKFEKPVRMREVV